jgi:hypothetical protein
MARNKKLVIKVSVPNRASINHGDGGLEYTRPVSLFLFSRLKLSEVNASGEVKDIFLSK